MKARPERRPGRPGDEAHRPPQRYTTTSCRGTAVGRVPSKRGYYLVNSITSVIVYTVLAECQGRIIGDSISTTTRLPLPQRHRAHGEGKRVWSLGVLDAAMVRVPRQVSLWC